MSVQPINSDSYFIDVNLQTDIPEEKNDIKIYKIKEVLVLSLLTYIATSAIFHLIGNETPLLNAFVPTTGYFISTLEMEKMFNLIARVKNIIQSCFSLFTKKTAEADGNVSIN